jgi:hypothetical protein
MIDLKRTYPQCDVIFVLAIGSHMDPAIGSKEILA